MKRGAEIFPARRYELRSWIVCCASISIKADYYHDVKQGLQAWSNIVAILPFSALAIVTVCQG